MATPAGVPGRSGTRRALRRTARLLAAAAIASGLAVLARAAYQIWDPGASGVQRALATQLQRQWRVHQPARAAARPIALVTGQPFAFIRIPSFGPGWRFAIVEGTSLAQLAGGPGHVTGTQLPGMPGNFAVAAHDITAGNPFLHLASLRKGDSILITTVNATYRYRVLSERVVPATDVAVLDPVPDHPRQQPAKDYITLITCTPVTLAYTPWRIIVTGTLASTHPG
jgi:sortase A